MQRIDLFPTPVAVFDVPNHEIIDARIMHYASDTTYNFRKFRDVWELRSEDKEIDILYNVFLIFASQYVNSILGTEYTYKNFKHQHGWINTQNPGLVGRVHDHGGVSIAATYYVNVNESSGTINLADPRAGVSAWLRPGDMFDNVSHSKSIYKWKPSIGKIIMIPGWLLHNVDINESNEVRVSVSTNIQLVV